MTNQQNETKREIKFDADVIKYNDRSTFTKIPRVYFNVLVLVARKRLKLLFFLVI